MLSKGIRGAITVAENTEESIKEATLECLKLKKKFLRSENVRLQR